MIFKTVHKLNFINRIVTFFVYTLQQFYILTQLEKHLFFCYPESQTAEQGTSNHKIIDSFSSKLNMHELIKMYTFDKHCDFVQTFHNFVCTFHNTWDCQHFAGMFMGLNEEKVREFQEQP